MPLEEPRMARLNQGLELVDRGGGGEDSAVTGGKEDPQGLAFAAKPGLDQMLGGQLLAARMASSMSVLRPLRSA